MSECGECSSYSRSSEYGWFCSPGPFHHGCSNSSCSSYARRSRGRHCLDCTTTSHQGEGEFKLWHWQVKEALGSRKFWWAAPGPANPNRFTTPSSLWRGLVSRSRNACTHAAPHVSASWENNLQCPPTTLRSLSPRPPYTLQAAANTTASPQTNHHHLRLLLLPRDQPQDQRLP